MIAVVDNDGLAVIQVRHRRDIKVKGEFLFLICLELLFSLYYNVWHIFRISDKVV